MKKPAKTAIELDRDSDGNYRVTKISHASHVPVDDLDCASWLRQPLRVGDRLSCAYVPDKLVDALASRCDVTVKFSRNRIQ